MAEDSTVKRTASLKRLDAGEVAPHLHRLSPDKKVLASWDPKGRLRLMTLSTGEGRTLRVKGIPPDVETFRWLKRGEPAVVFHTSHAPYLVKLGRGRSARASVPLKPQQLTGGLLDIRMVADGFIARSRVGNLFFVRPLSGERYDLTPEGTRVYAATTRSGDRIAFTVEAPTQSELWTYRIPATGRPEREESRTCEDGCHIRNWTPGSERLAYANSLGDIVLELPGQGGPVRELRLRLDKGAHIDGLWMSPGDRHLLASNGIRARLWDARTGELIWTWDASQGAIRSAHFMPDGRALLATDTDLYRLAPEKDPAPLRRSLKHIKALKKRGAFLDDVLPLPGGGYAFAVVRIQRIPKRPGSLDNLLGVNLLQD